jgi:hypothetical protein
MFKFLLEISLDSTKKLFFKIAKLFLYALFDSASNAID